MSNTNKEGRGTLTEIEVHSPADLPKYWRHRSQVLKECSAEPQAKVLEACAEQLELALNSQGNVLLTINEAAALSGYSQDHLRKLIRTGKIPSAGRPGKPLVRSADLPRKPREVVSPDGGAYDAHADACRLREGAKTRAL